MYVCTYMYIALPNRYWPVKMESLHWRNNNLISSDLEECNTANGVPFESAAGGVPDDLINYFTRIRSTEAPYI
jgi:hypothetical protein